MGAHREAAAAAAAGRRGPTRSDAKLHAGDVGYAPRQRVPRGVAKIRGLEGAAPLAAAADGGGRDSAAQRSAARAAAASTRRLAHQHAAADGASLGSHAIGDDVAEASESGSDTDAAVAAAAAAAASAAAAAAPSPPSPAAAAAAAAALAPAPRPAAPPHPHPPSPAGEHGGGGGALRLRLRAALRRLPKPLRHLLAGAVSGGVAKTATSPLEVVRMRLMVSKGSATVASVVAQTWAAAGPAGFWAGNGADVLRTAPQKSVQLASFDFYKRLLSRRDPETGAAVLPGWASTAAGSLAGVTSTSARRRRRRAMRCGGVEPAHAAHAAYA